MKKIIKINFAALISVFVAISLLLCGCSKADNPSTGYTKSEKALKVYTNAVQKTKNTQNFDLKLTTSIKLENINCTFSLFDSILKKVFNHRLGSIDDRIDQYSFVDGVLKDDKTISPQNVVQPVNSEISDDLFDGVKSSSIYYENDIEKIRFIIAEETNSADKVMETFVALSKEVGTDFENYDIRKAYPQADALAKYHANFIDLMSVAPRIKELMDMNNNHQHSADDTEPDFGEFGKTTEIENGIIYLGDTTINAELDDDDRLVKVTIDAPVGIDVNVNIIHNSFKATARFKISQTYEYSYSE